MIALELNGQLVYQGGWNGRLQEMLGLVGNKQPTLPFATPLGTLRNIEYVRASLDAFQRSGAETGAVSGNVWKINVAAKDIDLATAKQMARDKIAAKRFEVETGGVIANSKYYSTDRDSQAAIARASGTVSWKAAGTVVRDVVQEDFMTDIERQQQLADLGYKIGKGSGHNCNCLIDSLLQLLVHHKVVKGPPSGFAVHLWRSELCEMTRSNLCRHDNIGLRPRLRDENNKEVHATEEQHARAFLEHHKHGKAILQSLLNLAKLQNECFERTLLIIVFFRFDGRIVNPFDDPVVYEFRNDSDMPVLDMYLYNTTGDSHTGLHIER